MELSEGLTITQFAPLNRRGDLRVRRQRRHADAGQGDVTFYGVFNMRLQQENAIKECNTLEAMLAEFPARERWTWRVSRAFDLRLPVRRWDGKCSGDAGKKTTRSTGSALVRRCPSQQAGNGLKARYYRTYAEKTASGFAARGLQ